MTTSINQSDEFFASLANILQAKATATLSAQTSCGHLASIAVNAGEVQAIRYSRLVGPEALASFQSLEIESFSHKDSSSNLLYKPAEKPVSTQAVLMALSDRMVLPTQMPQQGADIVAPAPATTTPQPLSYRGQAIAQASPATPNATDSAPSKTYEIQYRGSKGNPFMRRNKQ